MVRVITCDKNRFFYLSIDIYLKSQDYGDVIAGAQKGRLTMS